MADETPAEREERLQRQEERLAKQHERLSNPPPARGGGGGGGGKFLAGIGGFIGEHKIIVIGIGLGIVAFVIYMSYRNSNNTTNGSNAQGSLGNAGYQDQGTAYALTQLSQQMDALQNQLDKLNNPTSPPPGSTPPPPSQIGWPTTALAGMKIWQGTQSHNIFFGPKGPQPGRTNQTALSSLFPAGTTFRVSGNQLFYTEPGGTEQTAPITLVPGMSSGHKKHHHHPKNNQANKSPTLSFLQLSPAAVPGTDLSHPGIGGWGADPVHFTIPFVNMPPLPLPAPPPHPPHLLHFHIPHLSDIRVGVPRESDQPARVNPIVPRVHPMQPSLYAVKNALGRAD